MDKPSNLRLEEIFAEAADLPTADRSAWLDTACAGRPDLRVEVEALLRSHDSIDFMQPPSTPLDPEFEKQMAWLKPEEAGDHIGNYKLIEQIGEGGFGTVWRAEQEHPVKRLVALKLIKIGMDTREVIARFEQERQALAVMDHASIAKVYDAGTTKFGRPYFVMELVAGTRIKDYCDKATLATRERLQLFIQVCNAVQHAHQKGIIHRDLKPSNILVTLQDGMPIPKVIDFGVAKAIHGHLGDETITTNLEQMIGTPLYMSPEQACMNGVDVDTRSDIYSLGVLLYELLTGRTPFNREDLKNAGYAEIRRLICEVEPNKPSTLLRTMTQQSAIVVANQRHCEPSQLITALRGDLDWIAMKAIDKDRTRRYATANGLALDIQRYLADEPVSAMPPSAAYRFGKFARRNKLGLFAGAAVLTTLVLGLIVSLLLLDRAKRAESDARANQQKAESEAKKAEESEVRAKRMAYATDMNRVQEALRSNNVALARQLLDRHRPSKGELDLRSWEWRYFYQQCRSGAQTMLTKRPGFPVFSTSYSRDGTLLVVGYSDGQVELWNVSTRERLKLLPSQGGKEAHGTFSPDGESFAATMGNGFVKTFNVKTGGRTDLCTVDGFVRDLSYSRDGEWLAVLSGKPDRVIVVRTADGGTVMDFTLPVGHGQFFNNVRISPDKQRMYVSCGAFQKPILQCVSIPDGLPIWENPIGLINENDHDTGSDLGFSAMDLSPDGNTLVVATGYRDPRIRVLDAKNGNLIKELKGHTSYILQVVFSRDGRTLASSSEDQTVRLWDTATWTKRAAPLRGHNLEVNAVAFSHDSRFLATGNKDGEVFLWDTRDPQPPRGGQDLPSHIRRVVPLPLSGKVLGRSAEKQWSLVDLRTLTELQLPKSEFLPDGLGLIPKKPQRPTPKFDEASGNLNSRARARAVSPDGTLLVVGRDSGEIGFYSVDGAARTSFLGNFKSRLGSIFGVTFAPDGQRFVLSSGGEDGIELWDVATRQSLMTLSINFSLLSNVEFTEDGSTLLASPGERNMQDASRFWRAPSFKEIEDAEITHARWPQMEAFPSLSPAPTLVETAKLLEAEYRKRITEDQTHSPEQWERLNATLENLAKALQLQDRYAESEAVLRQLLGRLKERLPHSEAAALEATKLLLTAKLAHIQLERQAATAANLERLTKEADALVEDVLVMLTRTSIDNPGRTLDALRLAVFQIWFEKKSEHQATSKRLIKWAEQTSENSAASRYAGLVSCLHPSGDPELSVWAIRMALNALPHSEDAWQEAWCHQTLALAHYRSGDYEKAAQELIQVEDATERLPDSLHKYKPPLQTFARFTRSMILFRNGKSEDAQFHFARGANEMKPFPADHRLVFENSEDIDNLLVWLAYKEARTLLQPEKSHKPKQ